MRNLRSKIHFAFILGLYVTAAASAWAHGSKRAKATDDSPVRILTYSSFMGKGSLGEWIQKQPDSPCKKHACKWITAHPNRSLYEELRSREKNPADKVDLVIGIDSNQLAWAREDKLVSGEKILLGESPLIILEHKKTASTGGPISIGEAVKSLKHRLILQDPRFSALAQTFVIWGLQTKAFTLDDLKQASSRVFPKWSASFEYFLTTPKLVLLTFATSQSYNDCRPGSSTTTIFPLKGSLPLYQEWIAATPSLEARGFEGDFMKFFDRPEFSKAVAELNWLIPKDGARSAPDCFRKNLPRNASSSDVPEHKVFQQWMDQWAL